jgi:hypothetical protein
MTTFFTPQTPLKGGNGKQKHFSLLCPAFSNRNFEGVYPTNGNLWEEVSIEMMAFKQRFTQLDSASAATQQAFSSYDDRRTRREE